MRDMVTLSQNSSKDFHDFYVWRKSRLLILDLFRITKSIPQIDNLIRQVQNDGVAITTHIALAFSHADEIEKLHFIQIAIEDANNLEMNLSLAFEKSLLNNPGYIQLVKEVGEIKELLSNLAAGAQHSISD